jgi:hypothetical protein
MLAMVGRGGVFEARARSFAHLDAQTRLPP